MIPSLAKRLLTLTIVCISSFSQSSSHIGAQQQTESMVLNVTVTDDKGNVYPNLQPGNFSAFVDKVPVNIVSISTTSTPVSAGILVDVSDSMRLSANRESKGFWLNIGDGVAAFLNACNPENDYFASMFDAKITVTERWIGPDISLLRNLTAPGNYRGTVLYDALYSGVQTVMSGRHSRRVIVLISDGHDSQSKRTHKEVVQLLKRSDVTVYSIGIIYDSAVGSAFAFEGAAVLQELTAVTGGRSWFFSRRWKPEIVKKVFNQLATELQNQYQLTIEKQNATEPEKFRKFTVKLNLPKEKGRPKLYVRFRDGYYR